MLCTTKSSWIYFILLYNTEAAAAAVVCIMLLDDLDDLLLNIPAEIVLLCTAVLYDKTECDHRIYIYISVLCIYTAAVLCLIPT